jgi:hypothetical protein
MLAKGTSLIAMLLAVIFVSSVHVNGEESLIKFRVYKDFMKDIFEKNMKMIFERTEEVQLKDATLDDANTKLTGLRMNI